MPTPTDLTPLYTSIPASQWQVPDAAGQIILPVSGSDVSWIQLPYDLKSCTLIADGEDLYANVSYCDADDVEDPGDLTDVADDPEDRRLTLTDGQPWAVIQNRKHNKIYAANADGTGSNNLIIIPGKGRANGLTRATHED
jgi:hypothetical protein